MVSELITTILSIIRDINAHIEDYRCDDILIDNIFHKIVSIYPHIENLKDEDDQVTSQNCQRLHVIICKIKKEIKDYKQKSIFGRFCNINELKGKCLEFDRDIDNIFKNLKFNLIIKNNKNSDNLLTAKYMSQDIKKDLIEEFMNIKEEFVNINEKIKHICEDFKSQKNETDALVIEDLTSRMIDIFDNHFFKLISLLNSINFNICKLQSIIHQSTLFTKIFHMILSIILFVFLMFLSQFIMEDTMLDNGKIYT